MHMSYKGYQIEDFIADEEFKKWVLTPDKSSNEFWEKWMEANPGQRQTILSAREAILSFKHAEAAPLSGAEKGEILRSILAEGSQKAPRLGNIRKYRLAIAASLALVLTVGWYLKMTTMDARPTEQNPVLIARENPKGQKSKITLPDGSTLWLNSESQVRYASSFGEKRLIHLVGEGFFEVKEDPERPFVVKSRGVTTTALGTSFNVRAFRDDDSVAVGLVTGKVSVASDSTSNQSVIIAPGEMAVCHVQKKTLRTFACEDLDFIKWMQKTIVLEKAGLPEIVTTLERWYDVDIVIANAPENPLLYSGQFIDESLERVLERLAYAEDFDFKLSGKHVYIDFNKN